MGAEGSKRGIETTTEFTYPEPCKEGDYTEWTNRLPKEVIKHDLGENGKFRNRPEGDRIRTRFPPEPNGYLHIGHCKAIVLNFGLAKEFDGTCNLRFDDTNPSTEEEEYVKSIQEDIKWLGYQWDNLCFASNYFDTLYEYAVHLIKNGDAYVDSQPQEEMRKNRGNVTTPGVDSPYRTRSVTENLELFEGMKNGKFKEGEHILRAKMDMKNPNMVMRDPPLYRIMHKTHHNTGDKWCIYPLYDFAHGQEDAIEGITHSICTLEFITNREGYDWFIDHLPVPAKPKQYEVGRLNVTNTVMSKRKLLKLVKEGVVDGWNDPRMPTICGMRRRGVRPDALRAFCYKVGWSLQVTTTDVALLEDVVRDDLDPVAIRRMVVLDPLLVTIKDCGDDEENEAPNHPANESMGSRMVPFGKKIFIEKTDFQENAAEDFWRLKPNGSVKLLRSGGTTITVDEIKKDAAGQVTELVCTSTKDKDVAKKTKGSIHWVHADMACDMTVRCYNYLLKPQTEEEAAADAEPEQTADLLGGEEEIVKDDFMSNINPDSIVEYKNAKGEPAMKDALADTACANRYQFERTGFFILNSTTPGEMVFNRTIGLKESGAKKAEDKVAMARSRKDEQAAQAAAKEAKKSIPPQELFKQEMEDGKPKYTEFDADGIPTKDANGEAITKSMSKKLKKEWEKQKKLYENAKKAGYPA